MRKKNQVEGINRKNIKKILVLLSLTITIVTIYQIASIYALFQSEKEGDMSVDIAKWVIVVNDENINVEEAFKNFDVEFILEGADIAEGKFSPGMTSL